MFNKKYFWERLSVVAGLVATVVSVYSLWVQTRPELISVSMSVLSSEKVTDVETVPGVKAKFTYEGRDVLGLWKIKVRLENTSERNLIGVGSKSDLLYRSIPIKINEKFKVININSEIDNVGIIPVLLTDNEIDISFEQWSENETTTLIMYLEQLTAENIIPILESKSKSLINGKVIVTDNSDGFYTVKKRKPRFEIPDWLDSSIDLINSISISMWFVLILNIIWSTPFGYIKLRNWKKQYSDLFSRHLDSIIGKVDHNDIINMLESYKDQPYKAPSWIWRDFNGPKCPDSLVAETFKSTVVVLVICVIVIASWVLKLAI
ncbi:hypothetical protein [Aliivibrio sifiae]|uniref:Uncharacterized protein n=1 Tax=Aliivibrio sifiae TaxID=566293 RepID=A0A2S7X835_9GAMM|nr:hypothetical protein [Aliivibrio sifiae]PQJ87510.1 hypothetical protein BTO23_15500 [Aliivibrio sifiae]GLR77132.1 hypothetical protein GCM10007855_40070 [Aliivibrio sifiae]